MSLIRNKKIIDRILNKYLQFDNFEFDNSNSSFDNMLKADLMIADWVLLQQILHSAWKNPLYLLIPPLKL